MTLCHNRFRIGKGDRMLKHIVFGNHGTNWRLARLSSSAQQYTVFFKAGQWPKISFAPDFARYHGVFASQVKTLAKSMSGVFPIPIPKSTGRQVFIWGDLS